LVKVTANLLNISFAEVPVVQGDQSQRKSITGKFPVLETSEGHTIFEGISIAKYFARQTKGFYGNNDYESNPS
jgi:glutathione S-transferase